MSQRDQGESKPARQSEELGEAGVTLRDTSKGALGQIVFWFGVVISLSHIYANTLGTLPEQWVSALHWGSFAFLCALTYPLSRRLHCRHTKATLAVDILIGLLALACAAYVIFGFDPLYDRGVRFIAADWIFSILAVVIALELVRRVAGWFIPLLCLVGLTYVFWWGKLIGGIFHFPGLTLETTLFRSYFEVSGMFGPIARISSTFVFMFILFGAFLVRSGAGDFVVDMARSVAGRLIGGPGLVAVLGSALTGTVSGSAVANTVSTGVITIPLMKRAGFPAKFAAGVEASASTGGQIMPPIMGAGAFVMASYTQIPYLTIVAVSVLPAIMYFLTVAFWVRIEAKKHGLQANNEEPPKFMDIMRRGGVTFLLPITALVALLVYGFTPTYAAAGGIVSVIVASWLTPNRMGPRAIIEALALGARNMVSTAMLLIAVGLIVMVVSATGIGNTISLLMADWAGGNLFLAIVFIGLASLVLGMGLPVTAAYIVLGTLSAPALYELIAQAHLVDVIADGRLPESAKAIFMLAAPDKLAALSAPMSTAEAEALVALVPKEFSSQLFEQALSPALLTTALLSAHMIIFWLSQDSNVTPPVCLTAFAAAAIAKTPPMATGLTAWRIAKGMYVIPLLFAYTPLLSGDWGAAIEVFAFGTAGLYGLAAAYEGYGEAPVPIYLRPLLAVSGVALLWPLALVWHLCALVPLVALLALPQLLDKGRRS
jgi:TRAP transporter 4TM/12TM fusion protein